MAVYVRCLKCHRLVPYDRTLCLCGTRIPAAGRNYYVSGRAGGQRIKRCLGYVTLEYARRKDRELLGGEKPQEIFTWKQARYAYLQKLELEHRTEKYIESTAKYLREMGASFGDDTPLDALTPEKVKSYFYSLLERPKPYSSASINRRLAAGRGAYKSSIDLPNPFLKVGYAKELERTAYLTDDERTRLLDCALRISPELWEIIQTALRTGLRKNEILRLRWDNLDFDNDLITLVQKGGRQRVVYLDPTLKVILQNIPHNPTGYLWPGQRNGCPYHPNWQFPWVQARECANLPHFRFHDLRHDFAVRAQVVTVDVLLVSKLLGHRNLNTTLRYAHLRPEQLRDVMPKLWPTSDPHDDNSK